jgi:hypothetical protein
MRHFPAPVLENERRLSIGPGSAHDADMSNRAPPHSFEIIFYSTASLLVLVGLTWYFFR